MRESRPEDNLQSDGTSERDVNPHVVIAVAGETRDINVGYEFAEVVYQEEYGSAPVLFNQVRNKRSHDLVMYLGDGYSFLHDDSLEKMIEAVWNESMVGVGAVYCDIDVLHKGEKICTKYNPPYTKEMWEKRMVLNVPFLVKSAALPEFNEEIETLYLWDGMLWLMRHTLLFHIPKTLLQVQNGLEVPPFAQDIELINGTHY